MTSTKIYKACGSDSKLQKEITNLLHSLIMAEGKTTLYRLGYVGSAGLVTEGQYRIKLYFYPQLALNTYTDYQTNTVVRKVVEELHCLKGWFTRYDVDRHTSFETRQCRLFNIVTAVDDDGSTHKELRYKRGRSDGRKYTFTNTELLVIDCNVDMALAAINDHDLADFSFGITKVDITNHLPKSSDRFMASSRTSDEHVAKIEIQFDDDEKYNGYDVNSVEPYYENLVKRINDYDIKRRDTTEKFKKKASKDAKRNRVRKDKNKSDKGFGEFNNF